MEERTEWQEQNKSQIIEEKWQTCWCCQDQQRACRIAQASVEKLEHTGPAKKERVASDTGAALAKRKRNRAVCPEHQIMRGQRVKVSESRTLASERRIRAGDHREERVDSMVNERRFQGGKGGQARRASREQVEGSMSG